MSTPQNSTDYREMLSSLTEHRDFYAHYRQPWITRFFGSTTNRVMSGLLSVILQFIAVAIVVGYGFIEFHEGEIFAEELTTSYDGEYFSEETVEAQELDAETWGQAMLVVRVTLPSVALLFFVIGRLLRSIRMRNLIIVQFQEQSSHLVEVIDAQISEVQRSRQSQNTQPH
jgi:hypothetical protein